MKGILDFFRGGDGPSPSQIARATKQVTQPHGDPAVRMAAAERLKNWGTQAAVAALLRRFNIQTPSTAVDLDECQEIEAMLVELGEVAVEPIVSFLEREPRVAYPARALERILPAEGFVARVLGILAKLEAGFGSHNEQRAGLLRALEDIDDPRIAAGAKAFLSDPNDDVAVAALGCVARIRDPVYADELADLLIRTADRPRVRREVAERLAELGFPMQAGRKAVEASLPEGFSLDKKGRVVSLR